MAEREFERDLERMFAQAPACPEPEAFARRVDKRLNRNWRVRTLALSGAGVIGGVVAVTQTLGADLGLRVQQASASTTRAVDTLYRSASGEADSLLQVGAGPGLFWIASGLMIIAAIIGATRAFDEI